MLKSYKRFIERLNKDDIDVLDEHDAKYYLIDFILMQFGHNIFDETEVIKEYCVDKDNYIDYCLKTGNYNKLFLEVKKPGIRKIEKYRDRLLKCAYADNVEFAAITNLKQWKFYLTHAKTHIKEKEFVSFDIFEDDIEYTYNIFYKIFSKYALRNNIAEREAELLHQRNKKIFRSAYIEYKLHANNNVIISDDLNLLLTQQDSGKICTNLEQYKTYMLLTCLRKDCVYYEIINKLNFNKMINRHSFKIVKYFLYFLSFISSIDKDIKYKIGKKEVIFYSKRINSPRNNRLVAVEIRRNSICFALRRARYVSGTLNIKRGKDGYMQILLNENDLVTENVHETFRIIKEAYDYH